jgi:predicted RNA-binding Zn-ribbon protein involved in translation (DUF1610 family)
MDPERLKQLIGDVLSEYDGQLPRTPRSMEACLRHFAINLEYAIAPQETGLRRRIYGQIMTFRVECPSCGAIIWTRKHKTRVYNPRWQTVQCPQLKCRRRYTIGLILWPQRKGPQLHLPPSDTIPPIRVLPEIEYRRKSRAQREAEAIAVREEAKAILAEEVKERGEPVNILEDQPLVSVDVADSAWDDGNDDPWPR